MDRQHINALLTLLISFFIVCLILFFTKEVIAACINNGINNDEVLYRFRNNFTLHVHVIVLNILKL